MWYQIKSFFSFYTSAVTKYNVQSPFLFDFVSHILDTNKDYYFFDQIEMERKRLQSIKNTIDMIDFGKKSQIIKKHKRVISEIAKKSVSNKVKCRILFNIVNQYKTQNIIELGTSLGISSSYLAKANTKAKIISLEGDPSIVKIAREVHQNLDIKNIEVIEGPFIETLKSALEKIHTTDLVFMDGHHKKQATLDYYETIYPYCHQNSVVVIDDIYWSEGMKEAWNILVSKPEVTLSIDLFDVGILFFRKELVKQQVSYISYKYKPWKIGLFG